MWGQTIAEFLWLLHVWDITSRAGRLTKLKDEGSLMPRTLTWSKPHSVTPDWSSGDLYTSLLLTTKSRLTQSQLLAECSALVDCSETKEVGASKECVRMATKLAYDGDSACLFQHLDKITRELVADVHPIWYPPIDSKSSGEETLPTLKLNTLWLDIAECSSGRTFC